MKLIGLTGGIGSGKTTVAQYFMDLGVPVYFADEHGKRLMHSSKRIRRMLVDSFGKQAYINGRLNRSYLAQQVFNDKEKLALISRIVHPSVANSFKRWCSKQKAPYIIQENAILFETGSNRKFDHTIVVTAPKEERIKRVMQRDGISKKQVVERMNNQLDDALKIAAADFVIHNTDLAHLKSQVLDIHQKLLRS